MSLGYDSCSIVTIHSNRVLVLALVLGPCLYLHYRYEWLCLLARVLELLALVLVRLNHPLRRP